MTVIVAPTSTTASISVPTNIPTQVSVFGSTSTQGSVTIQSRIPDIARRQDVKDSVGNLNANPWLFTEFEPYVRAMPRSKGAYAKKFATSIMSDHGMIIEELLEDKPTKGKKKKTSDLFKTLFKIQSGPQTYLTTIRMSLAHYDKDKDCIVENQWMLNHISGSKTWERMIFIGINPDTDKSFIGWMSKQDFYTALGKVDKNNRSIYFSHQQGGKAGNNDDYMSAANKLLLLINDGILKDISTW